MYKNVTPVIYYYYRWRVLVNCVACSNNSTREFDGHCSISTSLSIVRYFRLRTDILKHNSTPCYEIVPISNNYLMYMYLLGGGSTNPEML